MKNKHLIAGSALAALLCFGISSAAQAKSHLPYPYNSPAANAQAMQWWTNQQIYGNPLGPGYARGYNAYSNPYAAYNAYTNPYAAYSSYSNPYFNQYLNPYVNQYSNPYGYAPSYGYGYF